jgi:hypothetical protein
MGSGSCCLAGLALIAKGFVNLQHTIRDGRFLNHDTGYRNTSLMFGGLMCFLGMLVCVDRAVFFENRLQERHEHV